VRHQCSLLFHWSYIQREEYDLLREPRFWNHETKESLPPPPFVLSVVVKFGKYEGCRLMILLGSNHRRRISLNYHCLWMRFQSVHKECSWLNWRRHLSNVFFLFRISVISHQRAVFEKYLMIRYPIHNVNYISQRNAPFMIKGALH